MLLLPLIVAAPADANDRRHSFVHISDIHFDPFQPPDFARALAPLPSDAWHAWLDAAPKQAIANYGKDTNYALLDSALRAIGHSAATADFAIVTGDFLAHRFEEQTAGALAVASNSAAAKSFAATTTLFVAGALRRALPDMPIVLALGNNDSSCGDYRIEPEGPYLAATREMVKSLAGPKLVAADFDATYAAGGYYAMRHPTIAGIDILVLNDVLWSTDYENACGSSGPAAGFKMLKWLNDRLRQRKAAGGKVWLVRHIPSGIDAFSTTKSKSKICQAKVVSFLKEPFASEFVKLVQDYGDLIQASFAGHVHFDGYRLLRDASGNPIVAEKIAPAISPVFGQNPGFHLFTFDATSGSPTDFATIALASVSPVEWQHEYTFTKAYGEAGFSANAVAAIWRALSRSGPVQDMFRKFYTVGRGALGAEDLPAYACALGHAEPRSFADCYCGTQ